MGGGEDRRLVADSEQRADLPQLPGAIRVLELPAGEGLRQVSGSCQQRRFKPLHTEAELHNHNIHPPAHRLAFICVCVLFTLSSV